MFKGTFFSAYPFVIELNVNQDKQEVTFPLKEFPLTNSSNNNSKVSYHQIVQNIHSVALCWDQCHARFLHRSVAASRSGTTWPQCQTNRHVTHGWHHLLSVLETRFGKKAPHVAILGLRGAEGARLRVVDVYTRVSLQFCLFDPEWGRRTNA